MYMYVSKLFEHLIFLMATHYSSRPARDTPTQRCCTCSSVHIHIDVHVYWYICVVLTSYVTTYICTSSFELLSHFLCYFHPARLTAFIPLPGQLWFPFRQHLLPFCPLCPIGPLPFLLTSSLLSYQHLPSLIIRSPH